MQNNPSYSFYTRCDLIVSHLAYADDCIIFCKGNRNAINNILEFLASYQRCSGQKVNKGKSGFICSKNASSDLINNWHAITHFARVKLPFNYLGCPIFTGNTRNALFDHVIQKVRAHIGGWEGRLLSKGAKLLLIKHVLSASPPYAFQVVPPPKTIIKTLKRLFSKFLWTNGNPKRCLHWANWDDICFPFSEGGLDIRSLEDTQIVYECKLWWKFREENSLWSSFIKRKYMKGIHPSRINIPYYSSPGFKRLIRARNIAESHIKWNIGHGNLSFWFDKWNDCNIVNFKPENERDRKVNYFFSIDGSWDKPKFDHLLPADVSKAIMNIPIHDEDKIIWNLSTDGCFSFKDTWNSFRSKRETLQVCNFFWFKNFPFKISFFAWQAVTNRLPADNVLKKKGFHFASKCVWNCKEEESIFHILWSCDYAQAVWKVIFKLFNVNLINFSYLEDILHFWNSRVGSSKKGNISSHIALFTCWNIWKARNNLRFRDIKDSVKLILSNIKHNIFLQNAAFPYNSWQLDGLKREYFDSEIIGCRLNAVYSGSSG
ncbi:Putative ribonuclease H protein [Apostasia shenzhenica]|uniref:Ribonuclease H protein n=1 Tax=Apostasia shenzhenica TaxID=1088818 RepID=A0A2I0B8I8_9ASPA|nr:Putative ribonuclease H protein [Apostasia shenzhenica]